MNPRNWLLTTFASILVVVGTVIGINVRIDPYGLYWPDQRRHLPVYGDERVAKYLLAWRYVPERFNALLVGASITATWDVRGIEKLRVYNASINGGDVVEEKAVIDAALEKPGVSVVLLVVHPAMTYSHEFRTVDMKPELKRSALGSVSLWEAYKDMINIRLGRQPKMFDENGIEAPLHLHHEMNKVMKKMWDAPEFYIDPQALQAYKDLVQELRARGIRIVFIVPPTSDPLLQKNQAKLDAYMERMRSEIGTTDNDLWIDFTKKDFDDFRKSPSNFTDGVHLTRAGSNQLVARIDAAVKEWGPEDKVEGTSAR
jgi:hypothetical protein